MNKNLLKIFLTFIVTLCLQIPVMAEIIKFAQVTDVHFSRNNPYTNKVLKATVDDLNSQTDLAFIIFTGDNIDKSNESDLLAFMKYIKKLNKPYYIVIGNHDVFKANGISKERYMEIVNKNNIRRMSKKPSYVFKKNGFVFIVVDGAKEVIPGANGYYKADTLAWLEKQLVKNKKYPTIIFQHFPLVEPRHVKSHITYQGQEYLDMLKKHDNVRAVISGHYHYNAEKMQDGIYHISSPSLMKEPNEYKIIEIVTTKEFSPMIYTQLREISIAK